MKLILKRIANTSRGVFGVLMDEDSPLCVTIERPWLDNKKMVSCIPDGTYKFAKHSGEKFKNVWEILDVPDRTAILIHSGNTMSDVQGCVAVGSSFFDNGVLQSQTALDKLRKEMPDDGIIEIINCF